jgi:hypothetical protein
MKIVKVSTTNEVSIHEYPADKSYESTKKVFAELIGEKDCMVESVTPQRLYRELKFNHDITSTNGECVIMLVDEEGYLKNLDPNKFGSYLYKYGIIVGNILFISMEYTEEGPDFCGLNDDTANRLADEARVLLWTK